MLLSGQKGQGRLFHLSLLFISSLHPHLYSAFSESRCIHHWAQIQKEKVFHVWPWLTWQLYYFFFFSCYLKHFVETFHLSIHFNRAEKKFLLHLTIFFCILHILNTFLWFPDFWGGLHWSLKSDTPVKTPQSVCASMCVVVRVWFTTRNTWTRLQRTTI